MALRGAVENAQGEKETITRRCFYDRFTLRALLLLLAATSRISQEDLAYWRSSRIKRNAPHAIDVAAQEGRPDARRHSLKLFGDLAKGLRSIEASPAVNPSPRAAYRECSTESVHDRDRCRDHRRGPYEAPPSPRILQHEKSSIGYSVFRKYVNFWYQIADAGGERYLKSYCFGTTRYLLAETGLFLFAGLFRAARSRDIPSRVQMADFAAYGRWFQKANVAWSGDEKRGRAGPANPGRSRSHSTTESAFSRATSWSPRALSYFAYIPGRPILSSLPAHLVTHTSPDRPVCCDFRGRRDVAVLGGGQSAARSGRPSPRSRGPASAPGSGGARSFGKVGFRSLFGATRVACAPPFRG